MNDVDDGSFGRSLARKQRTEQQPRRSQLIDGAGGKEQGLPCVQPASRDPYDEPPPS